MALRSYPNRELGPAERPTASAQTLDLYTLDNIGLLLDAASRGIENLRENETTDDFPGASSFILLLNADSRLSGNLNKNPQNQYKTQYDNFAREYESLVNFHGKLDKIGDYLSVGKEKIDISRAKQKFIEKVGKVLKSFFESLKKKIDLMREESKDSLLSALYKEIPYELINAADGLKQNINDDDDKLAEVFSSMRRLFYLFLLAKHVLGTGNDKDSLNYFRYITMERDFYSVTDANGGVAGGTNHGQKVDFLTRLLSDMEVEYGKKLKPAFGARNPDVLRRNTRNAVKNTLSSLKGPSMWWDDRIDVSDGADVYVD